MSTPSATLISLQPAPGDALLLRAALARDGAEANEYWSQWRRQADWEAIGWATSRLLPQVYENLREVASSCPDLLRLKGNVRYTWVANQKRLRLLHHILSLFATESLPVMPIKGIALALGYYRSLGLRPMEDMDILVEPRHAARATQLLQSAGYQTWAPDVAHMIGANYAIAFSDAAGQAVDLHWHSMDENCSEFSDAPLWENARTRKTEAGEILLPGPEDAFLHVCAHGYKNYVQSCWLWMCDAAAIVRATGPEFSWSRVVAQARRRGLVHPLRRTLDTLALFAPDVSPETVRLELYAAPIPSLERWYFEQKLDRSPAPAPRRAARVLAHYWFSHRHQGALRRLAGLPAHLSRRWGEPTLRGTLRRLAGQWQKR